LSEVSRVSFAILALSLALIQDQAPVAGSIRGVVVNGSRDFAPVAGAAVVLRVQLDGDFVVAAETTADNQGRFQFSGIPADASYVYLPGANRAGVHYPGARLQLSERQPNAAVRVVVRDTSTGPSPLRLRQFDLAIQRLDGALQVSETLEIENPTAFTYIGQPQGAGSRATTMALGIPSNFRRATFDEKFYAQQFVWDQGRLITDVPWTPGRRVVSLTYILPPEERLWTFRRPLDLPCDKTRIEVRGFDSKQVACNVPAAPATSSDLVAFAVSAKPWPAGHCIELQLGRRPATFGEYGRWLALGVLLLLISGVAILQRSRGQRHAASDRASGSLSQAA
jgi:hypothetical protein